MHERYAEAPPAQPIPADTLRWRCDPASFPFETTAELEPNEQVIGQERALQAISLGLDIKSPGYNIFISGFVGTGRNTTIRRVLRQLDRGTESPDDLCYVYNFQAKDSPRALHIPAGMGIVLVRSMEKVVSHLGRDIPQVFESESYRKRKGDIAERFKERQRDIIKTFEKRVEKEGFALVQVQVGMMTNPEVVPMIEGELKPLGEIEKMVEAKEFEAKEFERLKEAYRELISELQDVVKDVLRVEEEMARRFGDHERQAVTPLVVSCVDEVRGTFRDQEDVLKYLDEVQEHVLGHIERFAGGDGSNEVGEDGDGADRSRSRDKIEYVVNLVVDNRTTVGAPVVLEFSPSASHLFGIIERSWSRNGEGPADHTRIKAGALHRANGGYLVLNATDLFAEPVAVWHALKRTLRTGKLEIMAVEPFAMLGPPGIKPEPVDIEVKVVMIGDADLYSLLYAYDEDFKKIFKVRADFDTEMKNVKENVLLYGQFVQRLASEEKDILPFDRTGLARIAEFGSRLTGRQDKLSTRFHRIADLIRESSYHARKDDAKTVGEQHVSRAIELRDYRNSLTQEKLQELIEEGTVFIDVDGTEVGEVNGLAVYDSGDHYFGLPSKITATVGMGNAGIINIEREADLSGRTHDKGMQILAGFIRGKFAHDKPLTLSASVCFEQSYHGVDGDSASSTEIYALMSALSGIPLRQDIAVTGSVNQKGEVQPIGGVNEKVEGFFDICKERGLTGKQGVLIPKANLRDLMLHPRVVAAVREGQFHVYTASTIDQGIEILTGVAAGERRRRSYPRNTVNGRVDHRLRELAAGMREFGGHV